MTILYAFLSIYVLWVFYLAVMNLKRAKDAGTLSLVARFFGFPVLVIGYLLDWAVNVVVFTALFADWPATWREVVTGRLQRYAHRAQYAGTRRQRWAYWFDRHLLGPFDPSGKHI